MTPSVLSAIVNWLRTGYPEGVPEQDYVPLLALLARRLSSAEVQQVAGTIIRQAPAGADGASNIDIGVQISKITDALPREEDLARVRARLAAAGWPLADPRQG